jgi:hypothetical protein
MICRLAWKEILWGETVNHKKRSGDKENQGPEKPAAPALLEDRRTTGGFVTVSSFSPPKGACVP